MNETGWDATGWDAEQSSAQETDLLRSMVRDRDWTADNDLRNRKWVAEEYQKGFEKLSRGEVTDLANYFRRFKRHKQTPIERREHLEHVFGSEGVVYRA